MKKIIRNKKILYAVIIVLIFILIFFIKNANKDYRDDRNTTIGNEEYTILLKEVIKIGDYVEYKPNQEKFTITKDETGYDSDQNFNTADYKGTWRVMYDDIDNGMQIISTQGVTKYLNLSGKFGYNNSVSILNELCNHYSNNSDFAISARCLGSNPTNSVDNSETENHYSAGELKKEDDNYKLDLDVINKYSLQSPGETTILASRYVERDGLNRMYLRCITSSGDLNNNEELLYSVPASKEIEEQAKAISPMNLTQSKTVNFVYIRPVIKLKQDVKVKSGDGTKENPYILVK